MLTQSKFASYLYWKSFFDFIVAFLFVLFFFPFFILLFIASTIDTQSNGIFLQTRIGQFGKPFIIYKLRTINDENNTISNYGRFLRKYKIDELPQFLNILKGEMSLVGPRPDIAGYYDALSGDEKNILILKPGLTSEASIKYRNEEETLKNMRSPIQFNDKVIFPDKVKMNVEYLKKLSFREDTRVLILTIKTILNYK